MPPVSVRSSTSDTAESNCAAPSSANDWRSLNSLAVEAEEGEVAAAGRRPRPAPAPPRSGPAAARPGSAPARALAAARAPSTAPSRSASRRDGQPGHPVAPPPRRAMPSIAASVGAAGRPPARPVLANAGRPVHGAAVAGGLQAAGGVDEGPHPVGPVLRGRPARSPRRTRRRAATGAGGARPGQPRVGRAEPGRRERALDQAGAARRRRRRCVDAGGRTPVDVQPQPHRGGRVGDVLVDERVGEPGQRQRRVVDDRPPPRAVRAGDPPDQLDDPAREVELR